MLYLRSTTAAWQQSREISRLDFTERICYQGWCSALTLRIITSISALPNIPSEPGGEQRLQHLLKLRLQEDDDVLVTEVEMIHHPDRIPVKIRISVERLRCLLTPLHSSTRTLHIHWGRGGGGSMCLLVFEQILKRECVCSNEKLLQI